MIELPLTASKEDILKVVESWVEALAQGDYKQAYEMTYHLPDDPYTPEFLPTWLANYGWHETYQVTSLNAVSPKPEGQVPPYRDVDFFKTLPAENGSTVGYIDFDLPLNGEWSDLTAQFDIWQLNDSLVLRLMEIHIM
jgi:hypothetical protein